MGILPRVRELLVPEKGLRYVDRDGRELATMPADLFTGDGSPVTELEIMKGDLTVILHELIAGQTDIVYGDRISALDETPGGVEVTFRSGAVRTYDLVVGADGIYSGVRALAFGPESDFVTHLGLYLGYCTVPDAGPLDDWFEMYNEPGRMLGLRPERGGTAKAMLAFAADGVDVDRRDVPSQKRLLRTVFAGMGWRAPELLARVSRSSARTCSRGNSPVRSHSTPPRHPTAPGHPTAARHPTAAESTTPRRSGATRRSCARS